MIDSRTAGSRAATRVRIAAPQGSTFNGDKGVVVAFLANDALLIRLTSRRDLTLPFGRSEVEIIP